MRRPDPQVGAVLEERLRVGLGVFCQRRARRRRRFDGAVVDVGEVHDVKHLVARGLEVAAQQVLEEEGPEVPEVGVVPDGRPARVERDARRREGLERLDGAGERVVEGEGHRDRGGMVGET